MTFDPRRDKPVDGDQWFSEMQGSWIEEQRDTLTERFGPDAVESVMQMVRLFADLIYIGTDNIPRIKDGVSQMAVVVNGMLPSLNERSGITRAYDHRDLDGTLGDIPERIQNHFVQVVGDVLLHSRGGPFDSAANINDAVDRLAVLVKGMTK